mmetsp:Transcript_1470/g.1684  ORF Transcript_1470/g.1684 Transcript_1470/m.1684 type:complete len:139 (+) Transcript_1470:2-418(+)
MHHLSTYRRRIRCLEELVRIVKSGGRINVQAWAMEQAEDSKRKFASTDVFVPFNAQPKYLDKTKIENSNNQNNSVAELCARNYDNAEYDERKGLVVFQRYCHMYREGEMEDLASKIEGTKIIESGYESGNHFILLEVL